MKSGWFRDSYRHSLAARGISTRKSMALILPIGISGSGKSTKVKELQMSNPDLVVVSPDQIREELTGSIVDQTRNKDVFDLAYSRTREALSQGKDVFFDATNVSPRSRDDLRKVAEESGQPVKALVFNTPVRLAKARVEHRAEAGGHIVPEGVIKRQRRILGSRNVMAEPFSEVELVDWRDSI